MNYFKIIKEEIKNYLTEGLSKIVYHYTYISHLISILEMNKFVTSSNLGSSWDEIKSGNKFYFFSTSRAKGSSGYGNRHGNVVLVLNGDKLNQRYKAIPVDYWNYSKKRSDYYSDSEYINALKSLELEDRIITNKPYIDNAKDYIMEIHILVNFNNKRYFNKEVINNIIKNTKIPIYFYKEEKSFQLQDKSKSISPELLELPDKYESEFSEYYTDENIKKRLVSYIKEFFIKISPILIYKNGNMKNKIENLLKKIVNEYNVNDEYIEILNKIENKVKEIPFYYDDIFHVAKAEIHNERGNPNKYIRELLNILIFDIKKIGAKNLNDYFRIKLGLKK